jgi:hypothetical protein
MRAGGDAAAGAFLAELLFMHEALPMLQSFRVCAPGAAKRASAQEYQSASARAIMNGMPLNIEDQASLPVIGRALLAIQYGAAGTLRDQAGIFANFLSARFRISSGCFFAHRASYRNE